MPKKFVALSTSFVSALLFFVVLLPPATQRGLAQAAPWPESPPSPSPTPSPGPEPIISVVIDSIVAGGEKVDKADADHIEVMRSGTTVAETEVRVGTVLLKGDTITTKHEKDQVVLRVRYDDEVSDDLIFLDPGSKVSIGSICLDSGRLLAWAGSRFRLCSSWGVLGVSGTEFEVEVKPAEEFTVVVYEGTVNLAPGTTSVQSPTPTPEVVVSPVPAEAAFPKPSPSPRVLIGEAWSAVRETIPTGTKLTIIAKEPAQVSELPRAEQETEIDRWSEQIIKTSRKKGVVTKGFVNYSEGQRALAFKQARREALVDKSDKGYLDMAQALNDWDNGAAAEKSLSKVKDIGTLRTSPEFMVNVAESQRLLGNLSEATAQIDKAITKHPGYAPAFYVSAKVSESRAATNPANKVNDLEAAKTSFRKALQNDSGRSQINAKAVEADLDKTIDILGKDALIKGSWFTLGQQWFTRELTKWVSYTGTTSLDVGGTHVTGKAVLYVFGNQFKLKTAEKIYTGKITGTPRSGATSFAMAFDDLSPQNEKGNVVISVIGTKTGNGIVLQSVRGQRESFVFKSQPGGYR
jgi:tetratricopeptide (TPR) repeat protein